MPFIIGEIWLDILEFIDYIKNDLLFDYLRFEYGDYDDI